MNMKVLKINFDKLKAKKQNNKKWEQDARIEMP